MTRVFAELRSARNLPRSRRMEVSFTPAEILAIVEPRKTRGSTRDTIRGVSALVDAAPGDLSFLGNPKYKREVKRDARPRGLVAVGLRRRTAGRTRCFFWSKIHRYALARVCSRIEQAALASASARRSSDALASRRRADRGDRNGRTALHCRRRARSSASERICRRRYLSVGKLRSEHDSWLMPGCVVAAECTLQNRVRLQPGVVIGSDGFGYEFVGGRHEKVPQIGSVVVEDDVEIGANSTIDRARFSRTVIGEGTKIDNLVQVGAQRRDRKALHLVRAGWHCRQHKAGRLRRAGWPGRSRRAHDDRQRCEGGRAGRNQRRCCRRQLSSTATPAIPYMLERRLAVLQQRLPNLFKRVDALEEQLKKVFLLSASARKIRA